MMNVTIVSAFRNAAGPQIDNYFAQIDSLANALARRKPYTRLNLILGYGDSIDGTGEALFEAAALTGGANSIGALIIDVSHGGKEYGSIEHPDRFRQLAFVGNRLWGCIAKDADVVALIESDLLWDAAVIVRLIDDLEHVPVVAPMVMDGPRSFYDVWAYRMDGQRFTKAPPYLPRDTSDDSIHGNLIRLGSANLIRLDSAGSVLVMDGDLARKVRFTDEEAIVGLCAGIYASGGSIWLDTGASVCHPELGGI